MGISIDGKALAAEELRILKERFAVVSRPVSLTIITCAPNRATQSYLALKQRVAESLGVVAAVVELPEGSTTAAVVEAVKTHCAETDGCIVQLPLPPTIDMPAVLAAIPPAKDIDVFSYDGGTGPVLPPVVGAIASIAHEYEVPWVHKRVVVLGAGRLVGAPVALFATAQGAEVTVLTADSKLSPSDYEAAVKAADIIVLGVGQARLLTPAMVTPGVVVFDAGASEDGGVLVGDADPAVAEVASLFTPVPGGIGPLTIAVLFRNLLELHLRQ